MNTLSIFLILMLLSMFVRAQNSYAECEDVAQALLSENERSDQHDITFNPNSGNFFLVFILETTEGITDIVGANIDAATNQLVGNTNILTFNQFPNIKRFPRVAYSPTSQNYLLTFKYDNENTTDLAAIRLNQAGQPVGSVIQLAENVGNQFPAAVGHNSRDNNFLVASEIVSLIPNTTSEQTDLTTILIDPNGEILRNTVLSFFDAGEDPHPNDSDPALGYDSFRNLWLLVWEAEDFSDDMEERSDILGVGLDREGVPFNDPFTIGNLTFIPTGTRTHETNVALHFSPIENDFVVVFEVDLSASGQNDNDVVIVGRVVSVFFPITNVFIISDLFIQDRNPVITYLRNENAYFVAYESDNMTQSIPTSRIHSTLVDSFSLIQFSPNDISSPVREQEHEPSISVAEDSQNVLLAWSSGPERPSMEERSERKTKSASAIRQVPTTALSPRDPTYENPLFFTNSQDSAIPMEIHSSSSRETPQTLSPQTISSPTDSSQRNERQLLNNELVSQIYCPIIILPSTSNIPSSSSDSSLDGGAIAAIVILCLLACAVLFLCVWFVVVAVQKRDLIFSKNPSVQHHPKVSEHHVRMEDLESTHETAVSDEE